MTGPAAAVERPPAPGAAALLVLAAADGAPPRRDIALEALAAGLPVAIGTPAAGAYETLDDLPLVRLQVPAGGGREELLRAAAAWAEVHHVTHIVVLDGDGRHAPAEARAFVAALAEKPCSIVVGRAAPGAASSPGRGGRLARLLLRVACGADLAGARCAFRAFPAAALARVRCAARAPERDVEFVVRALWAGLELITIPVSERPVAAPVPRPFARLRALAASARLAARNLNPWPHRRHFHPDPNAVPFSWRHPVRYWKYLHHNVVYRRLGAGEEKLSLRHPLRSLRLLHLESTTPHEISLACMLGIFLGALPLIACHTVAIVFYATRFRLNRAIAFYASNLCAPWVPPFVPALDIEVGHFLLHGRFITAADLGTREALFRTLCAEAHLRLFEYLLGSLLVGPALALLVGALVYAFAAGRRARGAAPDYGGRPGHAVFHFLIRRCGVTPAYVLLALLVPYYVLLRPSARRAAAPYLRRRFPGRGAWWRLAATMRTFNAFGRVLIDQTALGILGAERVRIDFPQRARLRRIAARKRGLVLLTSHFGGWQAAMAAIDDLGCPVHFQLRREARTAGRQLFDLWERRASLRIVSPDGFLGGLIELTSALQGGGCAAVMGDRAFGARTACAEFLGAPAPFPITPYRLALATGSDLIVLLATRTGKLSFRLRFVRIASGRSGAGAARAQNAGVLLQRYVRCVERGLRDSPFMWFNFFDFWNSAQHTRSP